jgi:hypothetical protein
MKYLKWLKANSITLGEDDLSGPISFVIKEQLTSGPEESGPLFEADRPAPNEQEVDNALNVAATTRALIIELVTNTPAHLHKQAVKQGDWSLIQNLQHIMEIENWYVSRLDEHPNLLTSIPLVETDTLVMKIFEDAMDHEVVLHEMEPEKRGQVFLHEGEEWTAAKVMRRLTQHLSEHYLSMVEIVNQLSVKKTM